MSKVEKLLKENMSDDGTVVNLRDKFLGLRGVIELAGNPEFAGGKKNCGHAGRKSRIFLAGNPV